MSVLYAFIELVNERWKREYKSEDIRKATSRTQQFLRTTSVDSEEVDEACCGRALPAEHKHLPRRPLRR